MPNMIDADTWQSKGFMQLLYKRHFLYLVFIIYQYKSKCECLLKSNDKL